MYCNHFIFLALPLFPTLAKNHISLTYLKESDKVLYFHHTCTIFTQRICYLACSDLKIGASIFGIYTGIVAYADDLILISSSLSSLQKMVNHCVSYGIENKIKFKAGKTEFMISGIQHLDSTTTYILNPMVNELSLVIR